MYANGERRTSRLLFGRSDWGHEEAHGGLFNISGRRGSGVVTSRLAWLWAARIGIHGFLARELHEARRNWRIGRDMRCLWGHPGRRHIVRNCDRRFPTRNVGLRRGIG